MGIKVVYCSECGTKLPVTRHVIKSIGRIIDLIEPHECLEEPAELDLEPIEVPRKAKGNFVENSDNLRKPATPPPPNPFGIQGTGDLRDQRAAEHQKSQAPPAVLEQIQQFKRQGGGASPAEGNLVDPYEEGE